MNKFDDQFIDETSSVYRELIGQKDAETKGAYTPIITAGSGTFTTVSATGYYIKQGSLVTDFFTVTITANGTSAAYILITSSHSITSDYCAGSSGETFLTGKQSLVRKGTSSTFLMQQYDAAYPGGTGAIFTGSASYISE